MNPPTTDPADSSIRPSRSLAGRWIAGGIAVLVFVTIAIAAQTRDLLNDRSVSNVISLGAGILAGLIVLAMLYFWLRRSTSALVSTLALGVIVVTPLSLIRFRGFTGEMIPILEYRFNRVPQWQQPIAAASDSTVAAATAFPQFLGANRDAVINQRDFAVPTGNEEEVWRIQIGEGWAGFAIEDQYCVTLEQRQERECVSCYRLSDGALLWIREDTARHQNSLGGVGPRSTPTIAGDLVYTQGATGLVHCLKLTTGEVVWKTNLLELAGWSQDESESSVTWGRAASPLVLDSLCVVPFGRPIQRNPSSEMLQGRSLIAFDKLSGEVRWTAGDDQISYASPVLMALGEQTQIVSVNEGTVTGHRIEDGQVFWSLDWPGQSNGGANCASALPVGDDAFLIAKGYGIGSAVFEVSRTADQWSVDERWASHRVLKTKFTHACVDGEVAYGLSDGTLECVRLSDGKKLWAQSRGDRYGHGQTLRVGDCLVVQAEDGHVAFVAASADEFKELSTINALSSKTWNVPAIAGELLLVRNDFEAVLYRLPARHSVDRLPARSASE